MRFSLFQLHNLQQLAYNDERTVTVYTKQLRKSRSFGTNFRRQVLFPMIVGACQNYKIKKLKFGAPKLPPNLGFCPPGPRPLAQKKFPQTSPKLLGFGGPQTFWQAPIGC
jgi:hypothetical protein